MAETESGKYDVIVIGGGPAGLAAAFWLARYRRKVVLFDAGEGRNKETWAVHGYLGVDNPTPLELRTIAREQATRAGAELEAAVVDSVSGSCDDFTVTLVGGRKFTSRRILFATGLRDIKPEIPGFEEYYGRGIWHCPDCDGPSVTGLRVGIIGWGKPIVKYAVNFLTWTERLTILTHSHDATLPPEATELLERYQIGVNDRAIVEVEGKEGLLSGVRFHDGSRLALDAIFFHVACGPGSTLPQDMGCESDEEGLIQVGQEFETRVAGVYAAGDLTPGTRLVTRAAYEGTRAAMGMHRSLVPTELRI
jgi:thioredoxin reductase